LFFAKYWEQAAESQRGLRLRRLALSSMSATSTLSSPGLTGRPSIPEAALLEPISRGVLDRPVKPGDDTDQND